MTVGGHLSLSREEYGSLVKNTTGTRILQISTHACGALLKYNETEMYPLELRNANDLVFQFSDAL